MQLQFSHQYQAQPDQVVAMMQDPDWLTEVASRAGATDYQVAIKNEHSIVSAKLPAPSQIKKFVGQFFTVNLDLHWLAAAADGSRDGQLSVETPGLPAEVAGTGKLYPAGDITKVDYTADFTIKIAFLGNQLEKVASPHLRRVIEIQQEVGRDYLAARA